MAQAQRTGEPFVEALEAVVKTPGTSSLKS